MNPLLEDAAQRASRYLDGLQDRSVTPEPDALMRLRQIDVALAEEPRHTASRQALAAMLIVVAFVALTPPSFRDFGNLNNLILQVSIIAIVATDAPLLAHQLKRLARRVPLGLARTGTVGNNSSGDIFLAFSTANEEAFSQRSGLTRMAALGTGLDDHVFTHLVDVERVARVPHGGLFAVGLLELAIAVDAEVVRRLAGGQPVERAVHRADFTGCPPAGGLCP